MLTKNDNGRREGRIFTGFLWRFAERCGAQGVSFVVSIILARLLAPEVYGTVALVTVFTSILQVFVDSGMGSSLIQKKDADDIDFSTVFYFNVAVCCVLYMGMYFAAPFIAGFYGDSQLTAVVRVLSRSSDLGTYYFRGEERAAGICFQEYAVQAIFLCYFRRDGRCGGDRDCDGLYGLWGMGIGGATAFQCNC